MKAIVYTLPDCPLCRQFKENLPFFGYEVEEQSADALAKGTLEDREALAEFMLGDGAAPIIVIDGVAYSANSPIMKRIRDHRPD